MLIVVTSNFDWTIHAKTKELVFYALNVYNTPGPFVAGVLYMLGFSSSVLHLCYMSFLRLLIVLRPFSYRNLHNKTIAWNLGVVWLVSALAATVPGNYIVFSSFDSNNVQRLPTNAAV